MRKTYLAFLVLTLFSVSIFTSCKQDDNPEGGTGPLIGTWVVVSGTTNVLESGANVTPDWVSYTITFSDATNYSMVTQDNSGNFVTVTGTYEAEAPGGNINFITGTPFQPEFLLGYNFNSDNTRLSFNQNINLTKGNITINVTDMVKQ